MTFINSPKSSTRITVNVTDPTTRLEACFPRVSFSVNFSESVILAVVVRVDTSKEPMYVSAGNRRADQTFAMCHRQMIELKVIQRQMAVDTSFELQIYTVSKSFEGLRLGGYGNLGL
jgi:hypothetical protein